MKLLLDNVDIKSSTGPNHFGKKLAKYLTKLGVEINNSKKPDIKLSFIETRNHSPDIPLVQRLDGIYFNRMFDFKKQNHNILKTYEAAKGVVFQTEFNRRLTFKYFGAHNNSIVIRNGADLEAISQIPTLENSVLDKYDSVWCCASSWRPHKRLRENIQYFLEHSSVNDCMVVAGDTEHIIKNDRVYYAGRLSIDKLISLYKRANYFIHLAWLDHCPNVVVDARACGCEIICSSSGGTREIAGPGARIILEPEWDLSPTDLYDPPELNYSRKTNNKDVKDVNIDMSIVSGKYYKFLENNL